MASSIPELSALYRIHAHIPPTSTKELTGWTIEYDEVPNDTNPTHPHFDAQTGVYITPKDGLYLLKVQLIPIGGPTLYNARQTRKSVKYAVHIEDPVADDEYLDVGSYNLGQMEHLRAASKISCVRMAGASGSECVRLNISFVQRKRKREEAALSKKEIKRRKRAASQATTVEHDGTDDDVADSSDGEWQYGFESDSTSDELPTSARSVGRLAKRLKSIRAE